MKPTELCHDKANSNDSERHGLWHDLYDVLSRGYFAEDLNLDNLEGSIEWDHPDEYSKVLASRNRTFPERLAESHP